MSMSRSNARIKAMIILYQINLYRKGKVDYDVSKVIDENGMKDEEFVCSLVNGVMEKEEELDLIANGYLNKWTINRLGLTDQAIIRMAIYELLYTDTPKRVCIDEAIEIAKDYSDEAVVKMINGVLDKVYHNDCNDE